MVEDIFKLHLSLGPAPLSNNAQCGITPLAFSLLTVQEENVMREDQDAYDMDTTITSSTVKADKRKCLSITDTFD